MYLGQYEMKNGCGKFNFGGEQREYLNGEKNGIWNEDNAYYRFKGEYLNEKKMEKEKNIIIKVL